VFKHLIDFEFNYLSIDAVIKFAGW